VLPDNTDALKPNPDVTTMTKSIGYNKPTYAVLIGSYVRVYLTKLFAVLPSRSKFMVKERIPSSSGMARVKLTLKCSNPLERLLYICYICLLVIMVRVFCIECASSAHILHHDLPW